ncbi:MAG: trypsin-like peptidase domain-containing protein [Ignavibacteriaceae bacterium]|nr:trypsin-like peptidase domain-containing protein [Ignavibacteriaceae bacterium]
MNKRTTKIYFLALFLIPFGIFSQTLKENANNDVTNSRKNILTETVAKVSPAVVGINVTEIRQYQTLFSNPFFDDSFFRQFFGDQTTKQKVKSLGSGILISPDGYIITNDHVAGNASETVVTLTNGKQYNAKTVGTDPVSDICLLKIEPASQGAGEKFPFIPFGNSDEAMIGEWVIALGNPFGLFEINDKPTVTVGVISATGMNLDPIQNRYYLNMLQTDAAINGGNSGGPLVNSIGELIGMNTIIYTAGGNSGSIGLGFAIPINKVKRIVDELKTKGKIERDFYPGFAIQNIDETIARYFKLESTRGVIVTQVEKNSSAGRAGIKPGDVITQINEYKINNQQNLIGVLQEFRTNQKIAVKIIRDNVEETINMKLETH